MIIIRKYDLSKIFIFIVITELLGFLSGYFVGYSSTMYYVEEVEAFMPPSWIFGLVWTILYACLGFIAYLIYRNAPSNVKVWFTTHMIVNYMWTYAFFTLGNYYLSFAIIVFLLISLYVVRNWVKTQSKLANIMCFIYAAWLLYALFLNGLIILQSYGIYLFNY